MNWASFLDLWQLEARHSDSWKCLKSLPALVSSHSAAKSAGCHRRCNDIVTEF